MKVLYDHQTFELQNFGGISRYFAELLRNQAGFQVDLALKRSSNTNLHPDDPWRRGVTAREDAFERVLAGVDFRGKGRIQQVLRHMRIVTDPSQVNLKNSLERIACGSFDLFHPTYYDPYFLEVIGAKPFVLTVHDMIFEALPDYFPGDGLITRHKKTLCEHASRIIAVSFSTKVDLMRFFGIDPAKIDVVHHGSSFSSGVECPGGPRVGPDRYMLFVGHRSIYKNFGFFLESIRGLLERHRDLSLVCVGPRFTTEEQLLFDRIRVREQVVHIDAGDRQLRSLYQHAELFAFPSRYEGFGMPILEAFSCGCPVVASDIAVFHEVAGEAAVFFNPDDRNSIEENVRRLLEDPELRGELILRGQRRVRRFSWMKTALKTLETYRTAHAEASLVR